MAHLNFLKHDIPGKQIARDESSVRGVINKGGSGSAVFVVDMRGGRKWLF